MSKNPAQRIKQQRANVAKPPSSSHVQESEHLGGLVQANYRQNQQDISDNEAMRLAHQVAARNQIDNPDLILPGQIIDFSELRMPPLARSQAPGPLELNLRSAPQVWQLQSDTPASLTAHSLAHRALSWPCPFCTYDLSALLHRLRTMCVRASTLKKEEKK